MRNVLIVAAAAFALAGCYRNETAKTVHVAQWDDTKSWHVTCVGYGGTMYDGNSSGPVEYDETGRISFIDAQTGKIVKSEGECLQVER